MSLTSQASLSFYADIYKNETTSRKVIDINLTQESLANIVGAVTEPLIGILHYFKEEVFIIES